MKTMNRIVALLLSLVIIAVGSVPAQAREPMPETNNNVSVAEVLNESLNQIEGFDADVVELTSSEEIVVSSTA